MTAVFAIVKRLLASNKISLIVTALVVVCATSSGDIVLSNGNYTWLLAALTPFFFVFYDFTKLMHLGASKRDYFFACLISYGFLALCISLVNTAVHLLIDPVYPAQRVINLMDVCGWTENGMPVAGLQQMCFLLLVMVFLHLLLSVQTRWYGWLTDAALVAVICVFTPVAPLRAILAGFFQMVMLNGNAVLHICSCLLLSAALSLAGLAALKERRYRSGKDMIQIRAVDAKNIRDVCKLEAGQDGAGTEIEGDSCRNEISLAEAAEHAERYPNAIYHNDRLIGFFMVERTESRPETATICRFMVGDRLQRRGLEEKALEHILRGLKIQGVKKVILITDRAKKTARNLARSSGLLFTGEGDQSGDRYELTL